VFVELMDEGVEVWRPVEAEQIGHARFRLPPTAPDEERWAIPPGSEVVAVKRLGADGPILAASAQDDPVGALEEFLERNPHDDLVRQQLIEILTNGIAYALHEVPIGVIDDDPDSLSTPSTGSPR
jgi:hypothetical protein